MKPPTIESKGESKGDRPNAHASASSVKSSVQAPVQRFARALVSKANKQKRTSAQAKEYSAKEHLASSPQSARKSPVPNLPFIKESKAARVTFTLLLVRPWVLVAGFWLFSLLGSAVAIQGLIKPRVLMQALPEAPIEAPAVVTSSLISVEEGDLSTEGETASASDADATETAAETPAESANTSADESVSGAADSSFPLWTLGLVTGTCAAGCLVMSRRRAMAKLSAGRSPLNSAKNRASKSRTSKSRNSKSRVRRKPVRADAVRPIETAQSLKRVRKPAKTAASAAANAASTKTATKAAARMVTSNRARAANLRSVGAADAEVRSMSRVKKRRQRNKRAAGPMPGAQGLPVKGRKQAQKAASHTPSARSRRVKRVSRSTPQGVVSVVPASESHALDWTNGSLAHQMDVRSHRKAM